MRTGGDLVLRGGVNFRDLGGCRATDGRVVRPGFLFRSGGLDQLTQEDIAALEAWPVTHVLDYRDQEEAAQRPDRLWPDVEYHCVPANPRYKDGGANLSQLLSQAGNAGEAFETMRSLYQRLPFGNPAYQRMFSCLRPAGESDLPPRLVQHCAIGKDRTGVGSALLLLALGVPRAAVVDDYLRTETVLASWREALMSTLDAEAMGLRHEALACVLSAREGFIGAALEAIDMRYGSAATYLCEEFELNDDALQALRSRYLTD